MVEVVHQRIRDFMMMRYTNLCFIIIIISLITEAGECRFAVGPIA